MLTEACLQQIGKSVDSILTSLYQTDLDLLFDPSLLSLYVYHSALKSVDNGEALFAKVLEHVRAWGTESQNNSVNTTNVSEQIVRVQTEFNAYKTMVVSISACSLDGGNQPETRQSQMEATTRVQSRSAASSRPIRRPVAGSARIGSQQSDDAERVQSERTRRKASPPFSCLSTNTLFHATGTTGSPRHRRHAMRLRPAQVLQKGPHAGVYARRRLPHPCSFFCLRHRCRLRHTSLYVDGKSGVGMSSGTGNRIQIGIQIGIQISI